MNYLKVEILLILIFFSTGYGQSKKEPPFFSETFDFSLAGYHLGQQLPPRFYGNLPVFKVEDFGAVPNDGKDDIDAIQRAVDAAEKAGGGIVLFPRGVFDFDVETEKKFVSIRSSRIIVRGWGDGADGTILHDHRPSHSPDPAKKWLGGMYPSFFRLGNRTDSLENLPGIRLNDAPSGSSRVSTKRNEKVENGVYVLVQNNPPDTSLTNELTFPLKKKGANHLTNEIKFAQMVRVLKNENGVLTLDAPLTWRISTHWNARLVKPANLIEESGIENFRLICDWSEEFIHHKNDIHDSGWDNIHVYGLENGWVRNITCVNPSSAVVLAWCKNCVVYDCQILGNRGHNGFLLGGGSTRNLWMNLKGGHAMHTFAMNGFCSGNVFFRCISESRSSIDCHGSLCHNNLFDNMYGPVVQNGGNKKALPPAHARGLVFYNLNTGSENAYNGRVNNRILRLLPYPGIRIYGLRSMAGFDVEVEDESGKSNAVDFSTPFGTVEKLNFEGKLSIPSLYQWQHSKRYGNPTPVEPSKEIKKEEAEED